MKGLLLYGPPASGKLTIAQIVAKQTGFTLIHNHLMLNALSEIFGFANPIRRKLEHEFRIRIMEEIVAANINCILTGVIMRDNLALYQKLLSVIDSGSGIPIIVRLTADRETLVKRVSTQSRKEMKKIDTQERLEKWFEQYPESTRSLLDREETVIDTAKISQEEVVEKIVALL